MIPPTPSNTMNATDGQFPNSLSMWSNRVKTNNFIKFDIVLICALLSFSVLGFCFAVIFVYGISCDTMTPVSNMITFIMTSWLTRSLQYVFNNNGNGNNNHHRSSSDD